MSKKPRPEIPPFDQLHPERSLDWRTNGDGRVVVLRPKLGTHRLGRWLSRRLTQPYCRIRLDDYGSNVWKACDGQRTVEELSEVLLDPSGPSSPDLGERLGRFLQQLRGRGMIRWREEQETHVNGDPGRRD